MNTRWFSGAIAGSVAMAFLFVGAAAKAANPEHMRQLLRTGDCKGCDLSGASLKGLNLSDANLRGANLSGATLRYTQLTRANLEKANLSEARLVAVDLMGANLKEANLTDLKSAYLCEIDNNSFEDVEECVYEVITVDLATEFCTGEYGSVFELLDRDPDREGEKPCSEAYFSENEELLNEVFVPIRDVLRGINLSGANLSDATLTNANLSGADLSYANLTNANGEGANFSYAMMLEADTSRLQNVDLSSLWTTKQAVGAWLIGFTVRRSEASERAKGRTHVSNMSRAQQAYYLENGEFSADLGSLGLGIAESAQYFVMGIATESAAEVAVQYAVSTSDEAKSALGLVFVDSEGNDNASSRFVLCESVEPGVMTVADVPVVESVEAAQRCPDGWEALY